MAAEIHVDLGRLLFFKICCFLFTLRGLTAIVDKFNELRILFFFYDSVTANIDRLGVLKTVHGLFLLCQMNNRFGEPIFFIKDVRSLAILEYKLAIGVLCPFKFV